MKRLQKTITTAKASTFTIPVRWEMTTVMQVEADSLKKAIQKVNQHGYELPDGSYVNDSFEIDYDRLENN